MALNPNILLQSQTPDMSRSLPLAIQTGQQAFESQQAVEQAPLRNKLLELGVTAQEQQNLINQAQLDEYNNPYNQLNRREQARVQSVYQGALQLKPFLDSGNIEGARNELIMRQSRLKELGLPTEETDYALQMLDNNPEQLKQITDQYVDNGNRLFGGQGQKSIQYGGTQTAKDKAGNLYQITQAKDPNVAGGSARPIITDMAGNEVKSIPEGFEIVGSTGQTMSEQVSLAESKALATERAKALVQHRTAELDKLPKAFSGRRQAKEMLSILDGIETGGYESMKKKITDFMGTTPPDIGKFNSMAGRMLLGDIRMLGANPTEGERQFLKEIQPSLEQGTGVNKALLNDLYNVYERQIERLKWLRANKDKRLSDHPDYYSDLDFIPSAQVVKPIGSLEEAMAEFGGR